MSTPLPAPPSRPPNLEDRFAGPELDRSRWVDHYLPHWTTPERSRARYDLGARGLRLRIDPDQPDWRPEDAPLRVSNLQTGTFSGGPGSTRGTHRHRPDGLVVRTETATRLLWAPSAGRVDLTVSASRDAGCMLAGWLVGTEHLSADDSGEVCVFEIDAAAVGPDSVTARCGIKAYGNPRLTTDMAEVVVPLDAGRPHTWTAIWGRGETVIGCQGQVLRRIEQAPDHPLFLMVDLFEIGAPAGPGAGAWVHAIRGWSTGDPATDRTGPGPGAHWPV